MKLIFLTGLLLATLISSSCITRQNFKAQLDSIVQPYLFSIASWELKTLPQAIKQGVFGKQAGANDSVNMVTDYFTINEEIKTLKSEIETTGANRSQDNLVRLEAELNKLQKRKIALEAGAAGIIRQQVEDTLTEQGIFNPIIRLKVSFPPLSFRFGELPYLLVISPRDRIESWRTITLKPSLTLETIEEIETRVDQLAVSSLVVELGGLGATYPSLVNNEANLPTTIETIIEEWLHQYLAFQPLGFLYLLDITGLLPNYEIVIMNETLASMVSKEIGAIVLKKYYAESATRTNQLPTAETTFDFNREMREIRKTVDNYLEQGEIDRAEEFMVQKRQYLAAKGYYIRKLNQAYFAFHGSYADSPTSVSPIGLELKKLREQSSSLKDFLNTVAAMTSHQELINRIK